ncbi:MAG: peptide chain release factor N(5)-glutamine methyltransferase [Bacilli bacterium]|nr:peptide chain release factor N(5)-glutamine methyltransferase [Bacilli bacterium]
MTVEDLIVYGKKYIHSHEVKMLLSHVLGYDNLELFLHLDEQVQEEDINRYKTMLKKVIDNYPIQYVLGDVNFYGREFIVNENVLIPRFETEELVYNTLNYIRALFPKQEIDIIDLGCGSGNIGITLKKELNSAHVTCIDISESALLVAQENAKRLDADITFLKSDMLDNVNGKYNVIISNPPYISRDEEIEEIVKNYEPNSALFANNDGLYFYEKILSTCKKNLHDKFLIAFEIGATQKDKIIELANTYFQNIKVESKKDMSDNDRMIFIYNI